MKIENSNSNDIPTIFELYKISTAYMKSKNQVAWPEFSNELVVHEINEKRQWKIVIDGEIACVWATTKNDELIWGKDNREPSIYIHRIAANPNFRGQNFVAKIVIWAKEYCIKHDLRFIRLDTVGLNQGLIKHYQKHGFEFLGANKLENTNGLPDHYTKGVVCLFQQEVK